MARTNLGDCIKVVQVNFTSAGGVKTIPTNNNAASKVLLQFYTDAAGAAAIGEGVMFYTPIVSITENGENPDAGLNGTKGFRLLNMASVLIEGLNNITNTKFRAIAAGYTVYCQISYYK